MQKIAHEVFSFDEFRLDVTRGALLQSDTEIRLRPKSFDVLHYLIENQGRLISKDELIEHVWQGTAVTDDSLVQCLKDIRRALGDSAQEIIKTVPRRGYIFDRPVDINGGTAVYTETSGFHLVIEEAIADDVDITQPKSQVWPVRHKTAVLGIALGIAALVLGAVFYNPIVAWYFKPPSLAILPIVNATGNPTRDYISDGLHESLITSLSQLNTSKSSPRLRVIAQNIMIMFKEKSAAPAEIGRQLGADTVLASRMYEQGNLRTFKFEMINVADGSVTWSKQYSVELAHPFDFLERQNQIASDVAELFPIRLSDEDRANLTRRYTQNPEAYDLFLKGRANRRNTPASLRQSIEYYQRAIELDPDFALPYWALGLAYSIQGSIDERASVEANELSSKSLQKALALDNNLTAARNTLSLVSGNNWDWDEVTNTGPTHPSYPDYLFARGRVDEGIEIAKTRLANAPYNPNLNFLYCKALIVGRRSDDAIVQAQHTLSLVPVANRAYFGPESPWIHLFLALAYSQKKMYAEAIAEQKTAIELGENAKTLRAELASIYAQAGQKDAAYQILGDLQALETKGEYVPSFNIAMTYCSLSDKESAFLWLDRAFAEREDRLPILATRPECDFLHNDPRFKDLIVRMGLSN
jgi:DNA-binding winged helix-turn-helix (wHTH) protein/TolB-like protein/Flp pilus assembly protein TadD